MSEIIAMWSGPRNLSTAMMRSFGSRPDCTVLDEPFYAPFLNVTGQIHPGRSETLANHETDPQKVAALCAAPVETAYHFQKHMPHHMLDGFPLDWARDAKHFFLLRHPRRVIASYVQKRAGFNAEDVGFGPQRRLYDTIEQMTGTAPPVIKSADILKAPEAALTALCKAIAIPFDTAMLSWPAGPRPDDGAWGPYWYASVETSTGFAPYKEEDPDLSADLEGTLSACLPDYEALAAHALPVSLESL